MKSPHTLILCVLLSFSCPGWLSAEVREWTRSSDGRKISAEFVGMKDENTVQIKMANGNVFDVPLSSLSTEDNEFVKSQVAKSEPAEKPMVAEGEKPAAEGETPPLPEGEVTITLSGVHLCCGDCEDKVQGLPADKETRLEEGIEMTADRGERTVVVKAPSGEAGQRALNALFAAGFYGTSDHAAIKMETPREGDTKTVTMMVRNLHMCCKGCVRDFEDAIETVDGVESSDVEVGAKNITISGKDFSIYEVLVALRNAGFGGSFR